jgi:LDH2 family malate/lactate/ureidoglycolate dehydrogenase
VAGIRRNAKAAGGEIVSGPEAARPDDAGQGGPVVVTGAAGTIGRVIRERLADRYPLRLLTHRPADFPSLVVPLEDLAALTEAFAGARAVVHLAAAAQVEDAWDDVLAANIVGVRNVYEAAATAGVPRVVLASSNHVVGGYEVELAPSIYDPTSGLTIADDAQLRPDSLYGVSKAFGEALGRYYVDQRGLSVVCLRIGTVRADDDPAPADVTGMADWLDLTDGQRAERLQATWLSQRDCAELIAAAIDTDERWAVAFGVSDNSRRFWSLEAARDLLGFKPQDGATAPADIQAEPPAAPKGGASPAAAAAPAETRVDAAALRDYVRAAARRAGVPDDQLELLVDSFVEADLRGVGSHGVARIPAYIRAFLRGIVNPAPVMRTVRQTGATMLLDADNGLGMVTGQLAMQAAVELSGEHGIAVVSVRNSNHSGMLATHVLHATAARRIGFFTSNAPAIMAPFGGAEPRLSNGPFAWAIPRRDGRPVIADMAASASARGRIRQIAVQGGTIPLGWALDAEGRETTDALAAMDGVILPMSGPKGSGIAIVNEVLAAVLSGAVLAVDAPRDFLAAGSTVLDSWGAGHLAMAIDPDALVGLAAFEDQLERFLASVTSSAAAAGSAGVLLPGEPEWRNRDRNLRDGLPLPASTLSALDSFAAEIGIERLAR